MQPREVAVVPRAIDPWRDLLVAERWEAVVEGVHAAASVFGDRGIWCVNSASAGGGVAEMLRTTLSYLSGVGLNVRWAVIGGDEEFFRVTKRVHNFLHGSSGDGGALGPDERETYERVISGNCPGLLRHIEPGDLVILHDPQTAGLVQPLKRHGCTVAWRSHIGSEGTNDYIDRGWSFVDSYVREADQFIFSRSAYVPECLADGPTAIVAPSIDPFAPKNRELDPETVAAILVWVGLLEGKAGHTPPVYQTFAGKPACLRSRVQMLDGGSPPSPDVPLVLQVSRWDRLKDHLGVMDGFVRMLGSTEAELILAGPEMGLVADDPEGEQVLGHLVAEHGKLPERYRRRVHIASLPASDVDENAVIVNALQRHAAIVTQKSIAEGFGLTVTEAMWKNRPMIASGVGGISEQVRDDDTGVLLSDPYDLDKFGSAINDLLTDRDRALRLARAGKEHVRSNFLHDRHLYQYLGLFRDLTDGNHGSSALVPGEAYGTG